MRSLTPQQATGKRVSEFGEANALQFNEEHGEVCPANWHKGEKALKATHEGIAEFLSNK
ncbi:MAG: hypothetical protein ISS19_11670 [Bacteroidales bacterium]|nr:hypothetical protein [Bacteroidales bacterium]